MKNLKPYFAFSFLPKNTLLYLGILGISLLFLKGVVIFCQKNPDAQNFIFWLFSMIFLFFVGVYFGQLTEKNKQAIREKDRNRNIINEKFCILKNKKRSTEDRQKAFDELLKNKFLEEKDIINIIKSVEDMGSVYEDEALERFKKIQQKTRDR